ncbi:hypothetical protein B0H17DRAFT_1194495 [Mycena rosella]|uniref:SMP-30/Gluconolactonase/LRE-like region domain-containing protein n=1 Tax=Mycena rosella TaxID=1033263 RepID=A0AAD7E0V8_MYCRO|nr:hypothetical protein B0H17DRAFT_1194495 [Mycena rosella]
MSRLVYLSALLAVGAAAYTFWLQPIFVLHGLGRVIQSLGSTPACHTIPALSACEKIALHAPTGVLYLACSSPESRAHWTPAVGQLNASGPANDDYIATYDPTTGAIARLQPSFPGLSVHGMDVVPSALNPSELFIYAVNHRKPADAQSAPTTGADSTVEIFKTTVGNTALIHLHTLRDPIILTPNDVVGSPDGQSLFFTNDHSTKTGHMRLLSLIGLESGSVGYCDVQAGCKYAIRNIIGANGIARAPNNDTIFVSSSTGGGISVLERQSDNALLKTHSIVIDRNLDNLSIDVDGVVWAAGIPSTVAILKHIADPSLRSPSSAHSVARNTGSGSFYGEKFLVFEDDGTLASGTTSVVHDAQRKRLFLHGIASPHLTICPL